mmetsp:Transcript_21270/g.38815  ORF Transcript_21270/g.38815 Transcript_21270/m.38815 type:complete len:189 (-) Transcript_21270:293-859(-)
MTRPWLTKSLEALHLLLASSIFWKALMVGTSSSTPLMVVASGGTIYGPNLGDVLLVMHGDASRVHAGDLLLYRVAGRGSPIAHRAMTVHEKANGSYSVLTKGDDNSVNDRGLYAAGQLFLEDHMIEGRVFGVVPRIGIFTIWLTQHQWLTTCIVAYLWYTVMSRPCHWDVLCRTFLFGCAVQLAPVYA